MTALQVSIGAVNDVVDAPRDAVGQPWKPIPAGLVRPAAARGVAVASGGFGLLLVAPLGPSIEAVALGVLVVGYVYDLRLKGTRWSWLPFAVGIPILPVFAWLGARGTLPSVFAVLVPTAVAAGAALALANSLVDVDEDRVAGTDSPAQAWGAIATRRGSFVLFAGVAIAAIAAGAALNVAPPLLLLIAACAMLPLVAAAWLGSATRRVRERAWEAQAAAIGLLATAWLGSLAAAGRLG